MVSKYIHLQKDTDETYTSKKQPVRPSSTEPATMASTHLHLFPLVLRSTQAILSLTSLILYATALASSPDEDSAYIYALVCCTITLLTLVIYSIPSFPTRKFFLWDFAVAVLWAALSGYFGMIFLEHDGEVQSGDDRGANKTAMKAAVGVDLVVMVCWVMSCLLGCVGYCRAKLQARRQRKVDKEAGKMLEGQEQGVVEAEWDDEDGECEKGLMGEKSEKKSAGKGV